MKCPYCGARATLTDSAIVYGGRSYGPIYLCKRYPECDSFVGVHPGTTKPLGRMANKELRMWKKIAHNIFDPLWQSRRMTRREAYALLATLMGIELKKCHIGMFDVPDCKKAYAVLKNARHEQQTRKIGTKECS